MGRAILMFLVVLGVVAGGLLLLRANSGQSGNYTNKSRRNDNDDKDDDRGW